MITNSDKNSKNFGILPKIVGTPVCKNELDQHIIMMVR